MTTPRPRTGTPTNVDFPEIQLSRLENGLTVLCLRDRYLPQVNVSLTIPGGKAANPPDNWALASLSAALVKEGTRRYSSRQIAEEIDGAAIDFDSSVSMEATVLSLDVLSHRLSAACSLLAEMALEPVFPESRVERYRRRWTSQLAAHKSDASYLAGERAYRDAFPDHPYSRAHFRAEDLAGADRERISGYWFEKADPSRCFVTFAGDCDEESSVAMARKFFGGWQGEERPPTPFPDLENLERRVILVNRPGSVQTRLVVASRSLPRSHPAYESLNLANQILGGGGSSRLFLNLREDKGLTYGAYSNLRGYRHVGILMASASLQAGAVEGAVHEIFREMSDLAESPPSDEDIGRARAEKIGSFYRSMETPGAVMGMELSRRLFGLPDDHYRTFVRRLTRLGTEDLQEAWRAHVDPEKSLIIVVGAAEEVRTGLEGFGPVEIYDLDGNRIE